MVLNRLKRRTSVFLVANHGLGSGLIRQWWYWRSLASLPWHLSSMPSRSVVSWVTGVRKDENEWLKTTVTRLKLKSLLFLSCSRLKMSATKQKMLFTTAAAAWQIGTTIFLDGRGGFASSSVSDSSATVCCSSHIPDRVKSPVWIIWHPGLPRWVWMISVYFISLLAGPTISTWRSTYCSPCGW